MAEGCCDLPWHHHAVTATWGTPAVGGAAPMRSPWHPCPSLGTAMGCPHWWVEESCGVALASMSHHGLAASSHAVKQPGPSALVSHLTPHHQHCPLQPAPRAQTHGFKPVSILEKTAPLSSFARGSNKSLGKTLLERFGTQIRSGALPAPVGLMPSPYLHHLLADVDDAEPVQELGEALQLGIALLQGHLPLAGQLPAEVFDQFALEEKAKALWDPLP